MNPPVPATAPRPAIQPRHRWAFYSILIIALVVRLHGLADQSLWLDELWGLEIATGHGAEHQALPVGRLLPSPPDLTALSTARPAWRVWTGMDRVTGPPGSYLLLRLWVELFGESEAGVRSLSVLTSTGAVAVLFLAVRPWAGVEAALWATALMAVAGPQVHAARDGRPYAPMMLLAVLALWVVGRTSRLGASRSRGAGLTAILLALLLMHYFAVAAVAAVAAYGLGFTRGAVRRQLVGASLLAGTLFAVAWGPFLYRQTAAFSHADPGAVFLNEAAPHHVAKTGWRVLTLPACLVVDAPPIPLAYGAAGLLAYLAAIALCLQRRGPAIWPLWSGTTVALLAGLDLARSTRHLAYIRYALLAAPPVYVAVGLLPAVHRAVGRLLAAATVAFAAWSLPKADLPPNADFRSLGDAVAASVPPGTPIVFAGPTGRYSPQIRYLAVAHYAGPPTGPVLLLEAPTTPRAVEQFRFPATVWMVADPDVRLARQWLPGYHLAAGQSWPVVGSLLRMERDPASAPTPQ